MPVNFGQSRGIPQQRNDATSGDPSLVDLQPAASDYEVGYARPPRHTQFRKGESGNRRGRPKGSKNLDTIIRDVAFKPVILTIKGKKTKVPMIEVALRDLMNKAAKGDRASILAMMNLLRLTQADEKVVEAEVPDHEIAALENLLALRGQGRGGHHE